MAALIRYQEDSQGYLLLLRDIVSSQGIPQAIYHDRHSIFEVPATKRESIEEQLAGKRELTQVGRAMEELGITLYPFPLAPGPGPDRTAVEDVPGPTG